ncbi:MAG: hypothetical protein IT181_15780 [Acidobacteria bacterium]|nr:hypothetical protein [Acidobacteriota bacterium]
MWRVIAFAEGGWGELRVTPFEGEPVTAEGLLAASRSAGLANSRLASYLAQEAEVHPHTHSAIETWASAAADQSHEFAWAQPSKVATYDEAIGVVAREAFAETTPYTLAWHDRTAVIIPLRGTEQRVLVEYVPGLRDEQRVERLRHRYASSAHRLETVLEWRGYFGAQSGVIDHWTTMRQQGRGFVASLTGAAGFIVATVVRRLTRPQPAFDRDPTQQARLIAMMERYPNIDAQCPDLARMSPAAHPHAVVFVHGTVSCGVQGLQDLLAGPARPAHPPIYRYEHDTFQPVEENARELAELVSTRLDVPRLLLAGHSRGGLVARLAAARLANGAPRAIDVYTFGTPHLGTPLTAMGGRLMNVLFTLGEAFAGAIPIVSPLTKAYGYLYDAPGLPPGIDAMREDSPALGVLNTVGDRCLVRAWGSAFDLSAAPSGFGVGVEGMLAGALADRTHDLVVPTASALGAGVAEPVLGCSHVHYFQQPVVRQAILGYGMAAAPGPGPAPAPGAGGVLETARVVVFNAIRLRKRAPGAG